MPLGRRRPVNRDPRTEDLLKRLVQEWQSPTQGPAEPVIIEENGAMRPTHLYVIGADWGELNQQDRSEIIMDACEQVRGLDVANLTTVAMGLTPSEAKRMGIEYETV